MHDNSIVRALRAVLVTAAASILLGGCYLLESAAGQLKLMSERRPIAQVIANPATPPALRSELETVAQIRLFATRRLALPDNGSYRSYADIKRPYVVWNVVAAPEFSLEPRQWCWPIVGCVAYRGYFVERRARRFADGMRRRNFDVDVEGVAAYSTLGHFDDPVLSSMLGWNDVELASIIFHELTHQLIYLPSDADFDEALAVTVEEEGVRRWLVALGRDQELERRRQRQQRFAVVLELLTRSREELRALYASGLAPAEMRRAKAAAFAVLRERFHRLENEWGGEGKAPFGEWFEAEINNAQLASIATYYGCVPGFRRELDALGGDLPAFYARVKTISKWDRQRRDALLCAGRALNSGR